MRVLLTGATGFIGAHLLRLLIQKPCVTAVLLRKEARPWRVADLLQKVEVIEGDLLHLGPAANRIRGFAPDVVIHTAWAGVGNKFRNESLQIDENLLPTIHFFRACAAAGCRKFIGLGSQAEYGPLNKRISEEDGCRPTTLYGATKLATSILLQNLCEQSGIRFAWLRVFSTYGPQEDPSWLIPYLVRELLAGKRPALTPGGQRWDYLFGPDAAAAIFAVAERDDACGIFNLGSGEAHALREIIEMIRDMIDPKLPLGFGEAPYRPDQVMHLEADITRLQTATGWTPATKLKDGLQQTVEWHKQQILEGQ